MPDNAPTNLFATKMMKSVLAALSGMKTIFGDFSEEELKIVAKYMFFLEFKEGDVIFREGDRGDFVCFVVDGRLEVAKSSSLGDDSVMSSLGPGDTLGEMAVIDEFPRSATVIAAEKTRLLTLSRGNFDSLVENYPDIGNKMLKAIARLLSKHLRKTTTLLAEFAQRARKRK